MFGKPRHYCQKQAKMLLIKGKWKAPNSSRKRISNILLSDCDGEHAVECSHCFVAVKMFPGFISLLRIPIFDQRIDQIRYFRPQGSQIFLGSNIPKWEKSTK
jgi:hypothetical protein